MAAWFGRPWWSAFSVGAWIAPLEGRMMGQAEVGGGQREDQVGREGGRRGIGRRAVHFIAVRKMVGARGDVE